MRNNSLSSYFGKPQSKFAGCNIPGAVSGVVGVCWLPVESQSFHLEMVSAFVIFKGRERKFALSLFFIFTFLLLISQNFLTLSTKPQL